MEYSRQAYWSGLPFPSAADLPNSGNRTWESCITGRCFTVWATRKALRPSGSRANIKRWGSLPYTWISLLLRQTSSSCLWIQWGPLPALVSLFRSGFLTQARFRSVWVRQTGPSLSLDKALLLGATISLAFLEATGPCEYLVNSSLTQRRSCTSVTDLLKLRTRLHFHCNKFFSLKSPHHSGALSAASNFLSLLSPFHILPELLFLN